MGRGGWYYDEDPNTDDWTALLFSSEWYTCYECNGTGKEDIDMTSFDFETREEYLEWRTDWKAEYKGLSKEIRRLKNSRKEFIWKYRPKGNDTMKRRTKVGSNPDYNSSADWKVYCEKNKATRMLKLLKEAKIEAGRQRAKRLVHELEAA